MLAEYEFAPDTQSNFLSPLVKAWLGRIDQSVESRKSWKSLGDECMHFYNATANFQWEKTKFWEGKARPTFQMVVAKAFELVAQIGPSLFFRSPKRLVSPRKRQALPQELFGDVENDPAAQQMFAAYQQEISVGMQSQVARSKLMESWLNYTPDQMPGGGMEEHVERAIIEALIRGRGVLWPEPYEVPGSGRKLTGLFFDTVEHLFIDPDAEKIEDARWVARKRVESYRTVEERFGLPRNSLRSRTTIESAYISGGEASEVRDNASHASARDLVTYYEIFSRSGAGCDYSGLDMGISEHLENVVGKNCYLAICANVQYPLNCPEAFLRGGAKDEDVRQAFEWPIPFWAGNHWPCVMLDFYPNPRSVWPMPPLAPGIGELKFINVMMSHLCNRIWMSSRDFIAVAKSAFKEVEQYIREGADMTLIPVSDVHEGIDKMIKFLDQPDVNLDAWQILDRVANMFDKRTGLTEMVYGITETQSRSAEDAATKREATSARPDHMARKVEKWMSRGSAMEAFVTRWFIQAEDVAPLVGDTAAQLWSWLIDSDDVDRVVSEMDFSVEAGSGRRRNHELEMANLNQALQFLFPELSKHADVTTDTTPINNLIQRWADAAQIDLSDIELSPRMPPPAEGPTPEEMELEMEREKHQMDMESKAFEMQVKQKEAEMKLQAQREKMQLDREKAAMDMEVDQAKAEQDIQLGEQKVAANQQMTLLDMLFKGAQQSQSLEHDQAVHQQEISQTKERGKTDLQIAKQSAAAKQKAMSAKAKSSSSKKGQRAA